MAKTTPAETETQDTERPPLPKQHHRGRGRPPAGESPSENSHSFFESLTRVDARDWGTRYHVYVYRLEPTIDRTRTGDPKYIQSYQEPINEDRLLADHGSGKYKMILNFRKPGVDRGDEIDTGYISVLNMNFPPKIAPGEWVDDPKNQKWSWAKKYFPSEQPQGNGAGDPMKTLETYTKIRKEIVAEVKPERTEAEPEERMLTLAAVIEKMVPKQDTLTGLAALLKEIRPPEDKLSQFLLTQHTQLMTEFLKTKSEDKNNNGIGLIREVVNGLRELLPSVKEVIPGLDGAGGVHRSRMNSWQEFSVAVAPFAAQILTPLSGMLAQVMMQRAVGGGPPPAGAPGHLPALSASTPATMMPFLQMIGAPMMNYARLIAAPEQIDPAELGADFASWVHEGFAANPNYDSAIVAARGMGTIGIMAAFRGTPLWTDKGPQNNLPSLAELEKKLPAFFEAFLNWNPSQAGDEHDDLRDEVTTFSEKGPAVN